MTKTAITAAIMVVSTLIVSCASGPAPEVLQRGLQSGSMALISTYENKIAPECKDRRLIRMEQVPAPDPGTWRAWFDIDRCGKPVRYLVQADKEGRGFVSFGVIQAYIPRDEYVLLKAIEEESSCLGTGKVKALSSSHMQTSSNIAEDYEVRCPARTLIFTCFFPDVVELAKPYPSVWCNRPKK